MRREAINQGKTKKKKKKKLLKNTAHNTRKDTEESFTAVKLNMWEC